MKLQVAMEYLLIIGLVLTFIAPLWIYVTVMRNEASNQLDLSYAKLAVDKLAEAADFVYSQGSGASVTIKLYIPSGVVGGSVGNNTIRLDVLYKSSINNVIAMTQANVSGTLPSNEGLYEVKVVCNGSYVQISY